mmetsp:Transcript_24241/g.26927  ORF Transcript_24241/g.26927 Transcript_24241/m.26927 type:complete len:238 (-) Transcript_24241:62-775(-)
MAYLTQLFKKNKKKQRNTSGSVRSTPTKKAPFKRQARSTGVLNITNTRPTHQLHTISSRSDPNLRLRLTKSSRRRKHCSTGTDPSWQEVLHGIDDEVFLRFREYSYARHTAESLSFLVATEVYRTQTRAKLRKNLAIHIYDTYIDCNTAREPINIPFDIVERIKRHIREAKVSLFEEARKEISTMLKYDVFPQFVAATLPTKRNTMRVRLSKRNTLENFDRWKRRRRRIERCDVTSV